MGGIPEIVQDGETGYLVDEGDLGAMAERIEQLGRDASLRQRMGCAAYRWAMENVEATSQTEKLDGFYDALSEQARPR